MTPKHLKVSSPLRGGKVNKSLADYFGDESVITNVTLSNKVKVTNLPKDFEEVIQ